MQIVKPSDALATASPPAPAPAPVLASDPTTALAPVSSLMDDRRARGPGYTDEAEGPKDEPDPEGVMTR